MTAEQEKLVVENMKLVPYVRKKYFGGVAQYVGEDDLDEEGYIALVRAARDYDPTRWFTFSTISIPYIRNTMFNYVESHKSKIHVPHGAYRKLTQDEKEKLTVYSIDALDTKDTYSLSVLRDFGNNVENHAVLLADIEAILRKMRPEKQKIIIALLKGSNMTEIAKDIGVTRSWIQKIVYEFRKQLKNYKGDIQK